MNTKGASKGLLFTVVTFLLLSGLLSFSLFYMASIHEMSSHIYSLNGDRLRSLDSDIGESMLSIMDTNLSGIGRSSTKIEINFTSLPTASSEKDYASLVSSYESFLEGDFQAIANNQIDTSLSPSLEIMPWNISILPEGATVYIYTENASAIQDIYMELKVTNNLTNVSASGTPEDQGGENPEIHIIIKDKDSLEIINANRRLTVDGSGTFYADFDDGSGVDVIFGFYGGRDGTLRVETSGLNATIGKTRFGYDPQGEAFISVPGNYLIGLGNLQKNQSIFLFEGV